MIQPILAVDVPDYFLLPIKILAVLGAATAGGYGMGWVAMAIAKLSFAQTIPRWAMWFIRTLGFLLGGLLAYLWLFGAGGSGLGGSWGTGGGGPKDGKVIKKDESVRKDRDKDKPSKDDKEKGKKDGTGEKDSSKVTPEQTLRIEVLGTEAIKRIKGVGTVDETRLYRVTRSSDLLNLKEVQDLIGKRKADKESPLLRVVVIIHGDSPDAETGPVRKLIQWAQDVSLEVSKVDGEKKAP